MFLKEFVHFSENYLFTHFSENFWSPSENLFVQFSRVFVHSQRTYFFISEIKLPIYIKNISCDNYHDWNFLEDNFNDHLI